MPFRFLDHTADARIECCAAGYSGLLEDAAEALYTLALRQRRADTPVERHIHAAGGNREETLVRWLQELIFLLDTEGFAGVEFHFDRVSDGECDVRALGYVCGPDERAVEVKSATYQQLSVRDTGNGMVAQVTFDL